MHSNCARWAIGTKGLMPQGHFNGMDGHHLVFSIGIERLEQSFTKTVRKYLLQRISCSRIQ